MTQYIVTLAGHRIAFHGFSGRAAYSIATGDNHDQGDAPATRFNSATAACLAAARHNIIGYKVEQVHSNSAPSAPLREAIP